MDNSGAEERLFAVGDAKLHGGMFRKLSAVVYKVIEVFPDLEAARPRSKSGIQALCSLHVALDKAKNLLQHCANCSKLYLAITSESVLLKFEKARCSLQDSLRRVEDIVRPSISSQLLDILGYLEDATMELDQSEKQAGDDVIQLLQKEKNFNGEMSDSEELEVFHQAAIRLGITSSRAALTERRALKKLVEKARTEEDKRKESIIAYLLHLMRKYSKLFRSEVADDTDSLGSAPCSPTVMCASEESYGWGGNVHAFDRQLSKLSSFNFKPSGLNSGGMPIPPEELRCPISLQLMYDPVIVSSGQTYERQCIEKWFNDGHQTCPKTQQQLSHLCLTPNYCVKGLITNWCEQNGVPVPQGPPDTLDLNYLRLALSECEATNSRSMESVDYCQLKGMKCVPFEDSTMAEVLERKNMGNLGDCLQDFEANDFDSCGYLLSMLYESKSLRQQKKVVEQIRVLLKDDEEARSYMGANGFTEALVQFLSYAVQEGDGNAQEIGAMALFNLAVNNDRNKETMLSIGIIPLLEEMISTTAYESAIALYLNLSCYDNAKPVIGSSKAVPFLIQLLWPDACKMQCKADALHCLYNLSTHPPDISFLLSSGIVDALHSLITTTVEPSEVPWTEKSMAIFINLASNKSGKKEIISTPGLVGSIASVLDTGEPCEEEQVVSCLLILCSGDQRCCHMVLQEGVIPALVSISVNGTDRGKEKAQKLLMLFREQRQRDISPVKSQQQQQRRRQTDSGASGIAERKPLCKSASKKLGRLTSLWKNKHFSVYQC